MRAFAVLATIYAAIVGTASALVDASVRTRVDVDANGYDTRASDSGCSPAGCVPNNTRDNDIRENSRWSCKGDILDSSEYDDDNNNDDDIDDDDDDDDDNDRGCCITYSFEEPQNIFRMRIAFHKGDENTRMLDVYHNGDNHSTITSSGSTLEYQYVNLYTRETDDIKLCLNDPKWNSDVWLSITEVKFSVN